MVGGVRVEVVSVMRSWIEEELEDRGRKRFFKIRGNDGFLYTLYYDEKKLEWFLQG